MLASAVVRKSALQGIVRSKSTPVAVRALATTPRSAATPDPDKDEDNILPVRPTIFSNNNVFKNCGLNG
jgi:hypothetical protein